MSRIVSVEDQLSHRRNEYHRIRHARNDNQRGFLKIADPQIWEIPLARDSGGGIRSNEGMVLDGPVYLRVFPSRQHPRLPDNLFE